MTGDWDPRFGIVRGWTRMVLFPNSTVGMDTAWPRHHHPNAVALLLRFGAEVVARGDDSLTPLLLASDASWELPDDRTCNFYMSGNGAWCQCPCSVPVQNCNGQTSSHSASRCRVPEGVALSLTFGAAMETQINDDMTLPIWSGISQV